MTPRKKMSDICGCGDDLAALGATELSKCSLQLRLAEEFFRTQTMEEHINFEMERAERLKAAEDINNIKQQLDKEEQRLFFFDRMEEIEMVAEEKDKIINSLSRYKPKGREKAMQAEDYIPPTV